MNNNIKILMTISELGYGGAEKSFIRLANLLSKQYEVTVAVFSNTYEVSGYTTDKDELNVKVIVLDNSFHQNKFSRWLNRYKKLRNLKKQNNICISFLTGTNILNALTFSNCKVITSVRGSRVYDPNMSKLKKIIYYYLIDNLFYAFSDLVVSISKGLTKEISKFSINKSKFITIPVFVDPKRYDFLNQERIKDSELSFFNNPVIVTTGRLSKEKGFDALIKIFSKIDNKKAKLLIIGDGPYKEFLMNTCKKNNLEYSEKLDCSSNVIFKGYEKNPLKYYKYSKCYILSSLTEGFSNALLESLQANRIVISVNSPWGPRDILSRDYKSLEAYPSNDIEKVDFGYLMPKINDNKYSEKWIDLINKIVDNKIDNIISSDRILDFDEKIIAEKWIKSINNLVDKK